MSGKKPPSNLPSALPIKKTGSAVATPSKTQSKALDRIRGAKVSTVPAVKPTKTVADLVKAAVAGVPRPRLVFAMDATASREPAWGTARQVTDAMFKAVPGELDVALAVHGGSKVHTFTPFSSDANMFRDAAASVRCVAGRTQLLSMLQRTLDQPGVRTFVYVGDVYEESDAAAGAVARSLKARGIRCILFHDKQGGNAVPNAFRTIADITGGTVLDFDASAPDLLAAVAALAVGGRALLQKKQNLLPGARLLLEHIKG